MNVGALWKLVELVVLEDAIIISHDDEGEILRMRQGDVITVSPTRLHPCTVINRPAESSISGCIHLLYVCDEWIDGGRFCMGVAEWYEFSVSCFVPNSKGCILHRLAFETSLYLVISLLFITGTSATNSSAQWRQDASRQQRHSGLWRLIMDRC